MHLGPFSRESSEPEADEPSTSIAVDEASPEAASGTPDSNEALRAVEQQLADLRVAFESQLRRDTMKDSQIDRLYQELETHKKNQRESPLQPILNDLIAMYDDITKVIEKNQGSRTEWSDSIERSIRSFQGSIIYTLERYGVERYQAEGDTYVSEQQSSLQGIDTTDERQAGKIERVRVGFRWSSDHRIIRYEMVRVYQLVQQPN